MNRTFLSLASFSLSFSVNELNGVFFTEFVIVKKQLYLLSICLTKFLLADFEFFNIDGEDVQLLIIGFINDIIYEETDGFVKLVKDGQKKQHEKSDLIKLITDLKKVVDGIDNEYAADEKNNLNKKLDETLNKINSIIPDNTAMKGENT